MENNNVSKAKEKKEQNQVSGEVETKQELKNSKFKSALIKKLVEELENKKLNNAEVKEESEIKDNDAISLYNIISNIDNMSEQDIADICDDINSNNIKVGIDSKAIELLTELKENENAKKLLQNLNISMDVDVDSISKFNRLDFDTVTSMGCKIGKVYVNSGWDEAAEIGYSADKYKKIVTNAEKMLQNTIGNLPPNTSQKIKFMAIYNAVINAEHYDYSALREDSPSKYTSRNLEGFFLHGKSVCAGTALALKNLCESAGIEVEYVQGKAQSKNENRPSYHAWIKAKIDGQWYNADPTWDANKVGKKYEFCLKSNRDFYGHTEDIQYNPTYRRDSYSQTHRRTGKTRKYQDATKSADRETLEKLFYDTRLDEKLNNAQERRKTASVSESYYKRANEQFIPDGMSYTSDLTKTQKLTFKQRLARFLSKSKYISNISFIKKFIDKNTIKKAESKVKKVENETIKRGKNNTSNQGIMSQYRVAPEVSNRYVTKTAKQKVTRQATQPVKKTGQNTITR